jgi:FkbM family methyltransferase
MKKWKEKARSTVYGALNRPGFRFLLSAWTSVHSTVNVGELCWVHYEGAWIQRFPTGTLVEPSLRLRVLPEIERTMRDCFMHQYLPRIGDVIVDIGAGSGWQTLVFSHLVGDSGRVIAVEAHPYTFHCLNEMCRRNKLRNVSTLHCAITATDGAVSITDSEHHTSNCTLEVKSGISVLGLTLDTLVRIFRLPRVDFLRMNIEGAEGPALSGMMDMIRRTRYVCIACHDFRADAGDSDQMRTKAEVLSFLKRNDFDITTRSSDPRPWVRDCVYGRNTGVQDAPLGLRNVA